MRRIKWWLWNRALHFIKLLLVVGAAIVVFSTFWIRLNQYIDPSIPQEKTELVRVLVESMIGAVLLVGLYYTWRRVTAAEKTIAISIEGQITERFTRAIDQLGAVDDSGNKRLEVRLGGIYGLQQIAQDSDKFYWQIMEVLTAYIRMNSPAPPALPTPPAPLAARKTVLSILRDVLRKQGTTKPRPPHPRIASKRSAVGAAQPDRNRPSRVPADIEAALLALAYRKYSYGKGEDRRIDLRRTDLRRADLSNFDLTGAWFDHGRLDGATLRDGDFREADFTSCHLEGAKLGNAHLEGADFSFANLDNAWLGDAHLEGALFYKAHFKGTHFSGAHLQGAWFENADLTGADLRKADLREAEGLTRQQLKNAFIDDSTHLPLDLQPSPQAD